MFRYIGIAVVTIVVISFYRGCFKSPINEIMNNE